MQPVTQCDGTPSYAEMGNGYKSIIKDYGLVTFKLENHTIPRYGYFVPAFCYILLSVKKHSSYQGCYFYSENKSVTLAFPMFIIDLDTTPEISCPKSVTTNNHIDFSDNMNRLNLPLSSTILFVKHSCLHHPTFNNKHHQ